MAEHYGDFLGWNGNPLTHAMETLGLGAAGGLLGQQFPFEALGMSQEQQRAATRGQAIGVQAAQRSLMGGLANADSVRPVGFRDAMNHRTWSGARWVTDYEYSNAEPREQDVLRRMLHPECYRAEAARLAKLDYRLRIAECEVGRPIELTGAQLDRLQQQDYCLSPKPPSLWQRFKARRQRRRAAAFTKQFTGLADAIWMERLHQVFVAALATTQSATIGAPRA